MMQGMSAHLLDEIVQTTPPPSDISPEETEYQYEELESHLPIWIRLAVILPGIGTEPIRCQIKTIEI